jgi:nitrogen regulatory protein PII-like uncharacterized protein
MAKVLLNVFVDYDTLGRTVNILSEQGVLLSRVLGCFTAELGRFCHQRGA